MRIVRYYPRACTGDGGMTMALRHWSETAATMGAEVVVAFDGGRPPESTAVEWLPVRHRGPAGLRLPVGLDSVLRGSDLLVVQSAWAGHNLRAAAIARRLGVPYLLEPRGAYDPHIVRRKRLLKRAWWLAWERSLLRGARAVHLFSESERPHLRALGYDGPDIVVANGVSAPDGPCWDGGSGGYLLWLGRFDPEHKGIDLLIQSVSRLRPEERPRLRLRGPERRGGRKRMEQLASGLGLDDWVEIGGPVFGDEKRELVARSTGFVYPSRWEAFGNALAEAAALGTPTLGTPYPLARYLAEQGGAFVAEPTPEALASGLLRLAGPDAEAVGRTGSEIVRREFTWPAVTSSWLRQVEALL
jgi:glycosyltransferase involved in cell wall biosynthesis